MKKLNHKNLWDNLIAGICREIVNIEKLKDSKKITIEDEWVEGTLISVLRKMCALQKLPPKMHDSKLTRSLFEG